MKNTYLVIPAYNEESRLPGVIKNLKKYFPLERVVVVDDGSRREVKNYLPPVVIVARHVVN